MIDTITVRLNLNDFPKAKEYFEKLRRNTDLIATQHDLKTDMYTYEGRLKNFRINAKDYYITVTGSLPKYYQGQNVTMLKKEDIDKALKQLEKDLGIPIRQGKLSRIDIAETLNVIKQPSEYINMLTGIEKGYAKKEKSTKYFHQKNRTAIWYDKLKELEDNDPLTYLTYGESGHLLRFEVRLERKIDQLLKRRKVRLLMLHSSTFLRQLGEQWIENYKATFKNMIQIPLAVVDFRTFREYALYQQMINMMGKGSLNDALNFISTFKRKGWPSYDIRRCKERFKSLYHDKRFSQSPSLVEELDKAVFTGRIVKYFLQN